VSRSEQYLDGRRNAIKWATTWLHRRAKAMNDPAATAILHSAAYQFANDAKEFLSRADAAKPDCENCEFWGGSECRSSLVSQAVRIKAAPGRWCELFGEKETVE
jgi:hypothetical protein